MTPNVKYAGIAALVILAVGGAVALSTDWEGRDFLIGKKSPKKKKKAKIELSQTSTQIEEDVMLSFGDTGLVSIMEFPAPELYSENPEWVKKQYVDFDSDGEREILVEYFTGGAHCCTEYILFKSVSDKVFQQVATLSGGVGSLQFKDGQLEFSVFEQIGYFYTCYACSIADSLPNSNLSSSLRLVYADGVLEYAETNSELNASILQNLEFLKARPIPALSEEGDDDGTRKAYAELVIGYYFNNDRNMRDAKKIFMEYYTADDADTVFDEIVKLIEAFNFGKEALIES